MAKPRTPSNVLSLKGAFAKDPARGRARENEPDAVGDLGEPPTHLTEVEIMCWAELALLAPAGVLCVSDRPFMEYSARVFAAIRLSPVVDPKLGIRFETIIGKLGMSPADRSKVSVMKKSDGHKDPYSEF